MTRPNLEELLKACARATPGPWEACTNNPKNSHQAGHVVDQQTNSICIPCVVMPHHGLPRDSDIYDSMVAAEHNRDFIAAAHPETVAYLCRRVLKLEEALKFYAAEIELSPSPNWDGPRSSRCVANKQALLIDCGQIARKALADEDERKEK